MLAAALEICGLVLALQMEVYRAQAVAAQVKTLRAAQVGLQTQVVVAELDQVLAARA
jgi:sugar (pentulose or hexulose) kinase